MKIKQKNWAPTINFFKKQSNWTKILEDAARAVLPDAVNESKSFAYAHYKRRTGSLGDSISGDVYIEGDKVYYSIESNHPAANLIEYGGYSPFPPWGKELSFPEAKAVYENQPFTQPQPFLRPAANNAVFKVNKQIVVEFNKAKP